MSHSHGGTTELLAAVHEPPSKDPKAGPVLWTILGLVLLLCLGLVAYLGTAFLRGNAGQADYPSAWDQRVAPYVAIVEEKRGLAFAHPVQVDFLPVAEFQRQVVADEDELSVEDTAALESDATLLRAVGLLDGGDDLLESANELSRVGIAGYYSDEDKRIRIRGTRLTPVVESTLVHELTHALQDQHFDLETRLDLLQKRDDPAAEGGFRAVVEGDAVRVQTAWRQDLPRKKLRALERSEAAQARRYAKQSRGIPKVLETALGAPYSFGEAMLRLTEKRGSEHDVDELFIKPPSTDEHLLDPWTFLGSNSLPLTVAPPKLRKGETKVGTGTFGASTWLTTLAERLPAEQTMDAVDGWGGDAYVTFTRDEVDCVRVTYRGDERRDLEQMADSLRAWVAAGPRGAAGVEMQRRTLVFESCDPGDKASPSARGSEDALALMLGRIYVASELAGGGDDFARCASDRLVRRFSPKQFGDPGMAVRMRAAVASCR